MNCDFLSCYFYVFERNYNFNCSIEPLVHIALLKLHSRPKAFDTAATTLGTCLGQSTWRRQDRKQALIHTGFHRFTEIGQIFLIVNVLLIKKKLSKLKSGKWVGQMLHPRRMELANILSEWLKNTGKGTWGACLGNRSVFILGIRSWEGREILFLLTAPRTRSGRMVRTSNKAVLWL